MKIDSINYFRKDVERIKSGESINTIILERENKISQLTDPKEIEIEELIIKCIIWVFQE